MSVSREKNLDTINHARYQVFHLFPEVAEFVELGKHAAHMTCTLLNHNLAGNMISMVNTGGC